MTDWKVKELEQIKRLVDEAETPQEKTAALDQLTTHIDSYIAENESFIRDLRPEDLKKKQEEMKDRLDVWDEEAREILEREITDPEMLKAALDNSRYRDEVITIAGTPFSQLGDDVEHPLIKKAEVALKPPSVRIVVIPLGKDFNRVLGGGNEKNIWVTRKSVKRQF